MVIPALSSLLLAQISTVPSLGTRDGTRETPWLVIKLSAVCLTGLPTLAVKPSAVKMIRTRAVEKMAVILTDLPGDTTPRAVVNASNAPLYAESPPAQLPHLTAPWRINHERNKRHCCSGLWKITCPGAATWPVPFTGGDVYGNQRPSWVWPQPGINADQPYMVSALRRWTPAETVTPFTS